MQRDVCKWRTVQDVEESGYGLLCCDFSILMEKYTKNLTHDSRQGSNSYPVHTLIEPCHCDSRNIAGRRSKWEGKRMGNCASGHLVAALGCYRRNVEQQRPAKCVIWLRGKWTWSWLCDVKSRTEVCSERCHLCAQSLRWHPDVLCVFGMFVLWNVNCTGPWFK